jgi:hypothetical protein
MSLSPVPSEQPDATCANCGAHLVSDQRYCLSCGQPVSPVRLAFLDVLAPPASAPTGTAPAAWAAPTTIEAAPGSYVTLAAQQGPNAWLRRNSGLLALIGILGLFLLAGLLVGHWVSASKTAANTTVKIEGLGGLAAAGSAGTSAGTVTTPSTTTPSSTTSSSTAASTPKQEKAEAEEATTIEKQPLPKAKKVTTQVNKLSKSHGKKHQEEINALGPTTPLEP